MTASPSPIVVQNVSKKFVIGKAASTLTLRERFTLRPKSRAEKDADRALAQLQSEFWALRDVGFTVEPGKPVGIIGHNGSGKSTMLKLLTGIMKPTSGTVSVKGRISALIEVGAGFHPDLSGRENVFLNGSILGLSRREIAARFDEIVQFAGLEQFIDTPVKRYSSGMYMRLGFAIAAHTNPDILLIDEVLAVGDAQFQAKCLRRLKEFVRDGGTAVFVSHSAGQVAEFCKECVLLDHGKMLFNGPTREALDKYEAIIREREEAERQQIALLEPADEEADARLVRQKQMEQTRKADLSRAFLYDVTLLSDRNLPETLFTSGDTLRLRLHYRLGTDIQNPIIALTLHRDDGLLAFSTGNHEQNVSLGDLPPSGEITLRIPYLALGVGRYRARVYLCPNPIVNDFHPFPADGHESELEFSVSPSPRAAGGCAYMEVEWSETAAKTRLSLPRNGAHGVLQEQGR